MAKVTILSASGTPEELELKDPLVAAALAWAVPGLGHLYQGRTSKGLLYMSCILGLFFFGFWLGGGRVVYAAWRPPHAPDDTRWSYIAQAATGLVAMPALVQAFRVQSGRAPLGQFEAPPIPAKDKDRGDIDQLSEWNLKLNRYFDLGTLYTVIAGLLNVLAICDAWGGPLQFVHEEEDKRHDKSKSGDKETPKTT